jgi:hypothetical protein
MYLRTLIALAIVPTLAAAKLNPHSIDHQTKARTVTFTEVNHPHTDVDLDLGPQGLSLGDEQIFHATLDQEGKRVGDVFGVGTVVQASDSGLSSQVVSTAAFPDGTFTLQLLFQMRFADGPPPIRHGAITGGTGAYRGVSGQCISRVIPDSDNNTITCTITKS